MKWILLISQIAFIHCFYFLGVWLTGVFSLPIPSGMIGMAILLLALTFKIIKLEWVEKGAAWLLAELLLFFVPSAVGIVDYTELFGWIGLQMLGIILISTFLVMGATAFTAERINNRRREAVPDAD
ncbi:MULTISPECIES: CidA/LrgA family holin-like protein [Bacillaceae]|uniref:CidA/LrgA family holin-like protein n=1 Tax=Metabacillus sediminis TaxID=3117746 RepID=A0ABZ2NKX3_9BACI|nr:CidA/LrgA family holin-like protein [Bacillus sp. SJS]KZZ85117.1 holin-like protein [Bacillus sp. SJS]